MTMNVLEAPAPADGHGRPHTIVRAYRRFRHWRKGRPFLGGLFGILAGAELWYAPLSPLGVIIHEGIAGVSAFFIGALMVMLGLAVWFAPAYRVFAGVATIMLGLLALPVTNLGGFVVGTILALTGGVMAVAWVPRPGWTAPTRRQRRSLRAQEAEPVEAELVAVEAGEARAETAEAVDAAHYETAEIVADPAGAQSEYAQPEYAQPEYAQPEQAQLESAPGAALDLDSVTAAGLLAGGNAERAKPRLAEPQPAEPQSAEKSEGE
jgi:hypothetical protein